jgi:D-2-hydroxyacid dehydrogenase (NADP+)
MVAGILLTARVAEQSAEAMRTIAAVSGVSIELALFPDDDGPITAAGLAGMEMAYASPDIFEDGRTAWLFLDAMQRAPDLRWVHLGWAGIDHPRVGRLLDRGVRLSNSPGAPTEPTARSVMAGLLALSRRLPHFAQQQRARQWQ